MNHKNFGILTDLLGTKTFAEMQECVSKLATAKEDRSVPYSLNIVSGEDNTGSALVSISRLWLAIAANWSDQLRIGIINVYRGSQF